MNRQTILILALVLLAVSVVAHDYVPGENQDRPILIVGGDVYTVSGEVLKETDILFEDGRITQLGQLIKPPPGRCEIIDATAGLGKCDRGWAGRSEERPGNGNGGRGGGVTTLPVTD